MTDDNGGPSDAFPNHVYDALGVPQVFHNEKIGGAIQVVEKRPESGPVTLMTLGVSRLPTESGEQIELAVQCLPDQVGAGLVALRIVCDEVGLNRRTPPVDAPWVNSEPILSDTSIQALVAAGSRWGADFDEVREPDGTVVGHIRSLWMLTEPEARIVGRAGFEELVARAGSYDALLDVTRESAATPTIDDLSNLPVFVTKFHHTDPPRWVTFEDGDFQSVTGLEDDAYMEDAANMEVWSVGNLATRFPFVTDFIVNATEGQTAFFADDSGSYVIEDD